MGKFLISFRFFKCKEVILVITSSRHAVSDFENFWYLFQHAIGYMCHWCREYQKCALSHSSRHQVHEVGRFETLPRREFQAQVPRSFYDQNAQVHHLMNPQCLIQLSNDRFPHLPELFFLTSWKVFFSLMKKLTLSKWNAMTLVWQWGLQEISSWDISSSEILSPEI